MKKNHLLIISLLMTVSACSTLAPTQQIPVEDHGTAIEQDPVDRAIALLIPDAPGAELQYDIDATDLNPNQTIVPVSPSVIEPAEQNAAVIALLSSAQQQKQQGDLRSAQTSLQRAQRIAPGDPDVYFALANTHRELQDYVLAEQVALKGVSIVQGQPAQLQRFWMLIAEIRTEAGNINGAKKASEMANRY